MWRRERDSNPRVLSHKLISSQPRYDHFDISPYMLNSVLEYNDYSIFHRTGRPVMSCCGARNFLLAVRFAKFRPLPLLFAPFIRHRRRSQTSPLRYLSVSMMQQRCIILTELDEMRLGELCSTKPLRISHRRSTSLLVRQRV